MAKREASWSRSVFLFCLACTLCLGAGRTYAAAHLTHGASTTDYATIQAAADNAVDGDTITVDAGTYREQVNITHAVVLQGAGSASTIIESPDNGDLVAVGPTTINGKTRMPILNLQAATGTITVRDLAIDGRYQGWTQAQFLAQVPPDTGYSTWLIGIAARDTAAVIQDVDIQHVAAPLDGLGNYEGLGTAFGIVAEGSSALSTPVTVTIQNATIGTFQKAGIVAWGPELNAVISGSHVSGVGVLGRSGQNGMQIGSVGTRAGTTATISGNTVDQLGAPADLVASGWGATGILPVTSGQVEADHNTITLDPSASANSLVGIDIAYSSDVATVHDNTLDGMSVGIQVDSPLVTAVHQIADNTLSTVGGDPVVFYYDPNGNGDTGGETIANFGPGYAIRVVGEDFSSGTLTAGDGSSVAANSAQLDVSGGNSTLYIDTTVANGSSTPPLPVTLQGGYLPSNFALSGEYIRYATLPPVTVDAATGNGTLTLSTTSPGCAFTAYAAEPAFDPDYLYPYGLVSFTLTCSAPGAQADVTITYPGSVDGLTYRKYGPTTPGNPATTTWYSFGNATLAGNVATLHLQDGVLGDDTAVDSVIVDQGGPGSEISRVPTLSQWGLGILIVLTGLVAVSASRRRQRSTRF